MTRLDEIHNVLITVLMRARTYYTICTEDEQFTMEKITGQRTTASGAVQYKIKWLGFSEQTWEPESNILDRSVID